MSKRSRVGRVCADLGYGHGCDNHYPFSAWTRRHSKHTPKHPERSLAKTMAGSASKSKGQKYGCISCDKGGKYKKVKLLTTPSLYLYSFYLCSSS